MRGSEQTLIHAIRGPITLITLGVLFALNNFTPYRFHQTWPVLLIVFGLLSLARRGLDRGPSVQYEGYTPPYPREPYPPQPPNPPNPPASGGGFRHSQYPDAESGPAKGGFGGTSAAQKPDAGGTPGGAV